MDYKEKYLKYKSKYLNLKKLTGGLTIGDKIISVRDESLIGTIKSIQPTSIFVNTSDGKSKTFQRKDEGTVWKVGSPIDYSTKILETGDNVYVFSSGKKIGVIEKIQPTSIFVREESGSGKTLQRSDRNKTWRL